VKSPNVLGTSQNYFFAELVFNTLNNNKNNIVINSNVIY